MVNLDGKLLSNKIISNIRIELAESECERQPKLVILTVGSDPASEVYVRNKVRACERAGMLAEHVKIVEDVDWLKNLTDYIKQYNIDDSTDGIIVQLPLPDPTLTNYVVDLIDPIKDVDGFGVYNMGMLTQNSAQFHHVPATVAGIVSLINEYNIETEGKNVVVLGRSNIVGRPLSILLSQVPYNANVTVLHSKSDFTSGLTKELVQTADILVSATGDEDVINMPLYNKVLIDVGIHRSESGKLYGDVRDKFTTCVESKTPVPGGVGPMTVASLIENTYNAFVHRERKVDITNW
jgi:methylenetetrahydrofolate dehydrogenase (NADP+)/methenyltetrahydrofolate cyclohydrolase